MKKKTTIFILLLTGLPLSAQGRFLSYEEGESVTVTKCNSVGECRVVFSDEGDSSLAEPPNFEIGAQVNRCETVGTNKTISSWIHGESFVIRQSDFINGTLEKTFDNESGRLYFEIRLIPFDMRISISVKYTSANGNETEWGHLNLRYGHDAMTNMAYYSCDEKNDEGTLNISIRANSVL